jgi:hypothetical protein
VAITAEPLAHGASVRSWRDDAACPVRGECLDFALLTNQDSGVWGGTSEDERRKLRRAWVKTRRAS